MKIAILVGISDYTTGLAALPACGKDLAAMHTLLAHDGRYEAVLVINKDTRAAHVKGQLVDFIREHKGKQVDEVLFYYSGHGEFTGDEFHFLLTDYDAKRKMQTTLQNSELDDLLKTLQPKLAVKVIDACQSGVSYIKDQDTFSTFLKGTGARFQSCYFFFSSHLNQSSFQDERLSYFTAAFLRAVSTHPAKSIRYKDLIDYISDAFSNESIQRPFFVAQADFTEEFLSVDVKLQMHLKSYLGLNETATKTPAKEPEVSLVQLVKNDAANYSNEHEAIGRLEQILNHAQKFAHPEEARELFAVSVTCGSDQGLIPLPNAIGKWLDQNEHDYFAKSQSTLTQSGSEALSITSFATRLGSQMRRVVTGFTTTVEQPYQFMMIEAVAKFPNVTSTACIFVPILSKMELRIFRCFATYEPSGWDGRYMRDDVSWSTVPFSIKDDAAIVGFISDSIGKFWDFSLDPLRERFKRSVEGANGETKEDGQADDQEGHSINQETPA